MLVFNASPLIVSAKAGFMDRFVGIWSDLVIPRAVVNEVMAVEMDRDPAIDWLSQTMHITRFVETNPPVPFLQAWDLGQGETSVLQFCLDHPGAMAVLDDMAARNCAHACGVPVTGTVGLVLQAAKADPSFSIAVGIQAVRDAGLYLSDNLILKLLS